MLNVRRSYDDGEKMLLKIQELSFAIGELNLYLDSHPNCKMAQKYFRRYNEELARATMAYEEAFGPLTARGGVSCEEWAWIDQPWPWENNCKLEGK